MKVLLPFLFIVSLNAFGADYTGQIAEKIIVKNDTFDLFSLPLRQYLDNHPEVTKDLESNDFLCSTALWRGYVTYWKLQDDKLYFVDAYVCNQKDKSLRFKLFPNNSEGLVFAEWFSGKLNIQKGNVIYYNHTGWERVYEEETVVQMEQGYSKTQKTFQNGYKKPRTLKQKEVLKTQIIHFLESFQKQEFDNLESERILLSFTLGGETKILRINDDTLKSLIEEKLNSLPPPPIFYEKGEPSKRAFSMFFLMDWDAIQRNIKTLPKSIYFN